MDKRNNHMPIKPLITNLYTAKCCGQVIAACDFRREANLALLNHIQLKHKDEYIMLQVMARKMASTSENGRCYFDNGKQKTGGWWDTQDSFKESWMLQALTVKYLK